MKPIGQYLAIAVVASLFVGMTAVAQDEAPQAPFIGNPVGETVLADQAWETAVPMHLASSGDDHTGHVAHQGGDCCRDCPEAYGPCWTFRGGALFLQQSRPSGVNLAVGVDFVPLINARDFGFDMQSGWEVGAVRRIDDENSLDFRYFQVDGWDDTLTSAPVNFSSVSFPSGLTSAVGFSHTVTSAYNSLLRSAEFNVRRERSDCLALLAGFRYVNLQESLVVDQVGYFSHRVETRNHLYGGQVGAEVFFGARGNLRLDGWAKAGIFGNDAYSDYAYRDNAFAANDVNAAGRQGQVSFVGDLGLTASYRLTHHIVLRGGYQMLWIDGVALGSDQFKVQPVNGGFGIGTTGGTFYHGALAGLEVNW
jgi:hypothetical protein